MKIKIAVMLTALSIFKSYAMEQPLERTASLQTTTPEKSPNEWMVGTYFALLPADLQTLLMKIMLQDPVAFGCTFEEPHALTLVGHTAAVNLAHFNKAGDKVVTASSDKTAKIWNAQNGSLIVTLGHKSRVLSARFSPTGESVVTSDEGWNVLLWRAKDGSLRKSLIGHGGPVYFAEFNPAGDTLLSRSADEAKIWRVNDGSLIATLRGNLCDARFDEQGNKIVTAFSNKKVKIWNLRGELLASFSLPDRVQAAKFNQAGDKIVAVLLSGTALWNIEARSLIAHAGTVDDFVTCAAFNVKGDKVVFAKLESTFFMDKTAKVLDMATGSGTVLSGHDRHIYSAKFNAVGDMIVTASADGTARLWNVEDGSLLAIVARHNDRVLSAEFDVTGDKIVTVALDGTAKIIRRKDLSFKELVILVGKKHKARRMSEHSNCHIQ